MTPLFSEPLEALEVGARFTTRGRTITEADVVAFSGLTGDWHPQHADAEWARPVRLGATIHVEGRIADIAPAGDDTGLVAVDLDVRDERDRTVIRGQVEVVWRRGDAPAAPPAERTEQDRTVVPL